MIPDSAPRVVQVCVCLYVSVHVCVSVYAGVCRVTEEKHWDLNAPRKLALQLFFAISWDPRQCLPLSGIIIIGIEQGYMSIQLCRRKCYNTERTRRTVSQAGRTPFKCWQGHPAPSCFRWSSSGILPGRVSAPGEESARPMAHAPPELATLLQVTFWVTGEMPEF